MKKDEGLIRLCGIHTLSGVELTTKEVDDEFGSTETCNAILFTLDGVTYELVEDPADGYRSYHRDVLVSSKEPTFKFPGVKVLCHMSDDSRKDSIVMRDMANGKVILEAGTDYTDGYYPYCEFVWTPENMAVNEGK